MVSIELPVKVQMILNKLVSSGYEAYCVGGCVRDSLRGVEPHDWDICTNAIPQNVKSIFESNDYNVIETGIKHGTVAIVVDGELFEITTFRSESSYSDHRHPDEVTFVSSLSEDLARRDFKMNAIACDCNGLIIDPYNGRFDIQRSLISCVGDPDQRFEEDPLRILRGIRFAARFNYDVEPTTSISMHKKQHLLRFISAERIAEEVRKMFVSQGESLKHVLNSYSDIITFLIPELHATIGFDQNNKYHELDVWNHTLEAISKSPVLPSPFETFVLRFALLLHDIAKPHCYSGDINGGHFYGHGIISRDMSKPILDRLKLSNDEKESILNLVQYHESDIAPTKKSIKRWLNKLGKFKFKLLLELKEADINAHSPVGRDERLQDISKCKYVLQEVLESEEAFTLKDLKIDGNQLMYLGIPEGPEIGKMLNCLLQKVIDGEIENDYNVLVVIAESLLSHVM